MNNPIVRLLDINDQPMALINTVWNAAKTKEPLVDIQAKELNIEEITNILIADLPIQEYVWTVWCIEGMPRAFWDQLDRCRHAAFWEQSLRILDLKDFEFWYPRSISDNEEARGIYENVMDTIQHFYSRLLDLGIPSEDARGIIPLHTIVRGTMAINLRALKKLISSRTCPISQGEYWKPILSGMKDCLKLVLPWNVVKGLFSLPCDEKGYCPIESNVLPRITGEDPNSPCPIYMKNYYKGERSEKTKEY